MQSNTCSHRPEVRLRVENYTQRYFVTFCRPARTLRVYKCVNINGSQEVRRGYAEVSEELVHARELNAFC